MRKVAFFLALISTATTCIAQPVPAFSKKLLQQAKSGDDNAQRALAYDYFYARGTHKNLPAAAEWYKLSADHGNPSSAANYAVIEVQASKDRTTSGVDSKQLALTYFTKAANGGYIPAYVGLGDLYATQKDFTEAAHWYRKAADRNNAVAEFELGRLYLQGKGIPKDEQEGKMLLKKAAHQGSLAASNMLTANGGDHSRSGYYGGFTPITPMP